MINTPDRAIQYNKRQLNFLKESLRLECLRTARLIDEIRDEKKTSSPDDRATMAMIQNKIVSVIARKRMLKMLHQELDKIFLSEINN